MSMFTGRLRRCVVSPRSAFFLLSFLFACLASDLPFGTLPFGPSVAEAQTQKGISSDGRDFYFAVIWPSYQCGSVASFQSQFALIAAYYPNTHVTLAYFDAAGKEVIGKTENLDSLGVAQVKIDQSFMKPDTNSSLQQQFTSCHIHSNRPVNVQYYSTGPNSGGMFLVLPTSALGTHYVVAALPSNPAIGKGQSWLCQSINDLSSSMFVVVATEDETHVRIIPNGTTLTGQPGVSSGPGTDGKTQYPINVTLRRGECYWVKSINSEEDIDESGSHVYSDKPVAVVSGQESGFNGITQFLGTQEQRDLALEEMVPVDYWTPEGHVSMPFVDSGPRKNDDESNGDMYKVFVADSTAAVDFEIDRLGVRSTTVSPYQLPPKTFQSVETGINARSTNGIPIFVEQYDYRQHNTNEPFPAPSMMNVVPTNRWRKAFLWAVPTDAFQVHKKFYANVICRKDQADKIVVVYNKVTSRKLSQMSNVGSFAIIPGHPELQGRRILLEPGSYYAIGDSAFMVYQYGMLGLDPDNDLGDNDGDDYYFSYATPCGQSFGIDGARKPRVEVDTLCSKWTVRAIDNDILDKGISQVELLNDPSGVVTRPPFVSSNTRLNPEEPKFLKGDKIVSFEVVVINPLKDAYAALYVVNGAGEDTVIELRYKAPNLSINPDSAAYFNMPVHTDSCSRAVFYNHTAKSYTLTNAHFQRGGQGYTFTAQYPLPHVVAAGDSVSFTVCYRPDIVGKLQLDTLLVATDCFEAPVAVAGNSATPKIYATDIDFGEVTIGSTPCKTALITNRGTAPLLLTKAYFMHKYDPFIFKDSDLLPFTLKPGESREVTYCFSPKVVGPDTSRNDYGTNLEGEYLHADKDYTMLYGRAVKPGVIWTWDTSRVHVQCEDTDTLRVFLKNNQSAADIIDSVRFEGPDAAEFSIIQTQLNRPLINDPLPAGDSLWLLVRFTPDLTKPGIARYATRHASLVAYDQAKSNPVMLWEARVTHAGFKATPNPIDFGTIKPGEVTGPRTVVISNDGVDTLVIRSITVDNPAFIIDQTQSAKAGTRIPPGQADQVILSATSTTDGLTTGTLFLEGETSCVPKLTVDLLLHVYDVDAEGDGFAFPETYVNCRQSAGHITARNLLAYGTKVSKIEIKNDVRGEFSFDPNVRGVYVITPNDQLVGKLVGKQYPVYYNPTLDAASTADVEFTFTTLDDPIHDIVKTAKLTGAGKKEFVRLTAERPDHQNYTEKTDGIFKIPLTFATPLPASAEAHDVEFTLSFRRDLFHYIREEVGDPKYSFVTPPTHTFVDPYEQVTYRITTGPSAAITGEDTMAYVSFQLMVARDTISEFSISSNIKLYGANGEDLCYIEHTATKGDFTSIDLCGDATIRDYLRLGHQPVTIVNVRPNPAATKVSVDYQVQVNNMPVTVDVYNSLGTKVATLMQNELHDKGRFTRTLDVSSLPAGMYSLRLTSPEFTQSTSIIVRK